MYVGLGQDNTRAVLNQTEAQASEKLEEAFVYAVLILGIVAAYVMWKR